MTVQPPTVYSKVYPFLDSSRFEGAHAGKVVVVTGAARNIGQHVAERFAMAGAAACALIDIAQPDLSATSNLCKAAGSKVLPFACDVSKESQVKATVDAIVKELGHIDILVNCAGVANSKPVFFESFSSMWRDIEVNAGGALAMTMHILPHMKANGSGCIVNVASRAGTVGLPYLASYSISKAAVIKLTESLQQDLDADGLGDKIHMYSCHPGAVVTDMSNRPMDPVVAEAYPKYAAERFKWIENFSRSHSKHASVWPEVFESLRRSGIFYLSFFSSDSGDPGTCLLGILDTSVELCGATCVFLATGAVKKALKGRFVDCEHDMEAFTKQDAAEEIMKNDLHTLRVSFLGGLPNDGGSSTEVFKFD